MAISTEEIKTLAKLAKLEFTQEQLSAFEGEFNEIIAFADDINAYVGGDAQSIREVSARAEELSSLRADEVVESADSGDITSGAKGENGYFAVRRVVR